MDSHHQRRGTRRVAGITTLGAMHGSDYTAIRGAGTLFDGETVNPGAVLVKYTYYGDTDFNGKVNFDDYARIDAGFNAHATSWFTGDFDGNGKINFDDYALIDQAFNAQFACCENCSVSHVCLGEMKAHTRGFRGGEKCFGGL